MTYTKIKSLLNYAINSVSSSICNLGNYSNPTADEAVLDVMLEGAIKGLNSAEDALSDPALVQEFKRREYVIVVMADEYASFKRHLHALSVKEQEIIIPLLKQEKDYYTLAEEAGVTVPVVRRKASRIHCELISYMENYFIEKLKRVSFLYNINIQDMVVPQERG